ncbi:GntR family transcriptional regulator, partial [Cloacibacillus evryensis]
VELACRNGMDRRVLERLEEVLRSEEGAFENKDIDAFLEANNTFHRLIAESGKNTVLCEYIDNIMLRTNVYIFFYDQFDEKDNSSSQEHRAILRAIAQRDKERAQEFMREHLHHSHRALEVPDFRNRD